MKIINKLKKFCCWIGWHKKGKVINFDGCSMRIQCKWCLKAGLMDSQGNLFDMQEYKPKNLGPSSILNSDFRDEFLDNLAKRNPPPKLTKKQIDTYNKTFGTKLRYKEND